MTELIGHFHPLLVHLPIGFLIVGLLLQWLSKKDKYASVRQAVPIVLLWGSVMAFISCITGYVASISGNYNRSLVNWHMWTSIAVVLSSALLYAKEKNPAAEIPKKLLSYGLLVLIMITAHFGGSLAHGSGYLTKPFLKVLGYDTTASVIVKPAATSR